MMKNPTSLLFLRGVLSISLCSLALPARAADETPAPENAKTLLERVKRNDLDRQLAAKQTEIDRLAQDLAKEHKDAETMEKSVASTGEMLKASNASLEQLLNDKKRLEQVLELTALRIEAERLKVEGLQRLADAQAKTLAALAKRAEETEARSNLSQAEMKQLSENTPAPQGKGRSPLTELRKKLAISETAAETADRVAQDAMHSASLRLEQADVASVRVKRKADGMQGNADLPPIAEKPEAGDLKDVPPPIILSPKKD
jgi:hypothetical protein